MSEFERYLEQQKNLQELGAIVIQGDDFVKVSSKLKSLGWQPAKNLEEVFEYFDHGTYGYIYYTGGNFKPIYDVITQYPTGMLELFNATNGKSYYCQNPKGKIIIVTTDRAIELAQKQGFDLLSKLGAVFRDQ